MSSASHVCNRDRQPFVHPGLLRVRACAGSSRNGKGPWREPQVYLGMGPLDGTRKLRLRERSCVQGPTTAK